MRAQPQGLATATPLASFMRSSRVFDLMASSSKVIVVDVRVPIKLAFFFLVEHGIKAAPVWNDERHEVVGMLTPLDLVQILCFYFKTGSMDDALNTSQTIETWIDVRDRSDLAPPSSLCCEPQMNLLQAGHQFLAGRGSGLWLPIMHPTRDAADFDGGSAADGADAFGATAVEAVGSASAGAPPTLPPVPPSGGGGDADAAAAAAAAASAPPIGGRMAMEDRDDQTVLGVISLLSMLNYLVQNMAAARAPGEEEEGSGGSEEGEGKGDVRGAKAGGAAVAVAAAAAAAAAAASSASSLFDASLHELGICGSGATDGYAVASDATLIEVLRLMLEHKISAVPVRNDTGAIDSVFSCDDVMFLMHVEQLQLQHLELPIREVIDYCTKVECFEGLHTCSLDDSLAAVIEKFVEAQVRVAQGVSSHRASRRGAASRAPRCFLSPLRPTPPSSCATSLPQPHHDYRYTFRGTEHIVCPHSHSPPLTTAHHRSPPTHPLRPLAAAVIADTPPRECRQQRQVHRGRYAVRHRALHLAKRRGCGGGPGERPAVERTCTYVVVGIGIPTTTYVRKTSSRRFVQPYLEVMQ